MGPHANALKVRLRRAFDHPGESGRLRADFSRVVQMEPSTTAITNAQFWATSGAARPMIAVKLSSEAAVFGVERSVSTVIYVTDRGKKSS
jgi:hypothetical protein